MIINANEARELSFKSSIANLMNEEMIPIIMQNIEKAASAGEMRISHTYNAFTPLGKNDADKLDVLLSSYFKARGYEVSISPIVYPSNPGARMINISWE